MNISRIHTIIILCILTYVPFHLAEEAIGNYPLWMSVHYNLPVTLSYPHWLINNAIFFLALLAGFLIYSKNKQLFLPIGIGIIIWSFMNGMEHVVFSFIDKQAAPGIATAVIFIILSLYGCYLLVLKKILTPKLAFTSILSGICYWLIPIIIIVLVGEQLKAVFPSS